MVEVQSYCFYLQAGNTVVHCAAGSGQLEVLATLAAMGTNMDITNAVGAQYLCVYLSESNFFGK